MSQSHGPNPASLSPARRSRLILASRGLDGRLAGATHREIARAPFGAGAIAHRDWISHELRDRSASVPIGLYAVHRAGALHVGELLVVTPPEPLASFLDRRRYLPKGVPLLKRVIALPGQTVCRIQRTIFLDGVAIGDALGRDHLGRPLPVWQGSA